MHNPISSGLYWRSLSLHPLKSVAKGGVSPTDRLAHHGLVPRPREGALHGLRLMLTRIGNRRTMAADSCGGGTLGAGAVRGIRPLRDNSKAISDNFPNRCERAINLLTRSCGFNGVDHNKNR
jgi:hypothetical protein